MTVPLDAHADRPVLVVGAGPAGLTAALTLARAGLPVVLAEASDGLGGIARTVERDGYRFDVGGHRFYTTLPEIRALWDELLGRDMLVRERRSRILYRGRAYDYPLSAAGALRGIGPVEAARIVASYAAARLRPRRPERSIADWFTNHFGRRLFETFFRSYTEKVWGLPCEAIGAQWAAQRVKGLDLRAALLDTLVRGIGRQRTLVTEFEYPRLGPGMLWERMAAAAEAAGARVLLRHRLTALDVTGGVVRRAALATPAGPAQLEIAGAISTIPLRDLVTAIAPAAGAPVAQAARELRYRDFLQVALILEGPDPVPDTWLYLHDRAIRAGRLQNFRAWSPALVPRADRACVGLEYFCDAGDALWSRGDDELATIAAEDLTALRLGPPPRVVAAHVVRVRDAYPVYDHGHAERVAMLRAGLAAYRGLVTAGRNGLHRYDNMDLAMWSGMRAARCLLGAQTDPWLEDGRGPAEPPPLVRRSTPSGAS